MMIIPLFGKKALGRVALVDDEDYEMLSEHRWHVYEKNRPGQRTTAYAATSARRSDGRQTKVLMHKLLTGYDFTDHANGNGLDNRRANLRPADKSLNAMNRSSRTGSLSSYKGVSRYKRTGRWFASIKIDGRQQYLGSFDNEQDAARAYDAAARTIFGEFAKPNFPGEGC